MVEPFVRRGTGSGRAILSLVVGLVTSLFVRDTISALIEFNVMGAAGAVVVR